MNKRNIQECERKMQRLVSNLYQVTMPKAYSAIIRDARTCMIVPDLEKGEIRIVPVFNEE